MTEPFDPIGGGTGNALTGRGAAGGRARRTTGRRGASLSRGDVTALVLGCAFTALMLGWFTTKLAQTVGQDRAVRPAIGFR